MDALTPIIRWADSKTKVFLTIELSDTKDPEIAVEEDRISFKGFGSGAKGENLYEATLTLFSGIYKQKSSYKLTDRCISFTLTKNEKESWPRLLKEEAKPGWLKLDFDKMSIDDSENEEREPQLKNISFENKVRSDLDRADEEILAFIKIAYLAIYNIGQGVAFWVLVLKLLYGLCTSGQDALFTAYDKVSDLLLTCQLCAILEIINPLLGIVKTGVVAPLIQVGGRNFILFILILPNKDLHSSSVVFVLFIAWATIEMVRYPFYVLSLFRQNIRWITWLRYSLWVVLYPLGLTCEGLIVYKSIPYSEQTGRLSVGLPNWLNFSFNFAYFLRCYIVLLALGGSYMMKHLLILRGLKLGYRKRRQTTLKKD
eukprot:Seg527.5 transcript_id=Seg527.5/GoldUCD/mRNA.D3Y31 product=Very-long-chain protein_id=Seg527.5/GoldUCD/D3Y31